MKKIGLNRDILVSLVVSSMASVVAFAIIVNGMVSESAALLLPLRNYGIPLGGVALFLTWTCTKENLDTRNQKAHKLSFNIALFTTCIASAFFIVALLAAV